MKSIILEAAKQLSDHDDKFQQWFHGSKVVDSHGEPLVVYHGTGTKIDKFDYEFTEIGHQQLGSGFYFTTNYRTANDYTTHRHESDKEKPGGEKSPNVLSVFLSIKKPLDEQKKGVIPRSKIKSIIEASPMLDEKLEDWGDVKWEGKSVVLARAIDSYATHQEIILQTLHKLSNDFYKGHIREFNDVVHRVLGYDGVQGKLDGETHWVAWFPEQIKSVNAKSFDAKSPYIMDCHERVARQIMKFKEVTMVLNETEDVDRVTITPSLIKERYGHLNDLLFNGELPQEKIAFHAIRSIRYLGRAVTSLVPGSGIRPSKSFVSRISHYSDAQKYIDHHKIEISTNYPMSQEQFDGILAHEMVHIWCAVQGYFSAGHDMIFRHKLEEVQAKAPFQIPVKEDVESLPKIAAMAGRRMLAVVREDDSGKYSGAIYTAKLIPSTQEQADEIAQRFGKGFYATRSVKLYDTTTSLFLLMVQQSAMRKLKIHHFEADEVKMIADNGREIGNWSKQA